MIKKFLFGIAFLGGALAFNAHAELLPDSEEVVKVLRIIKKEIDEKIDEIIVQDPKFIERCAQSLRETVVCHIYERDELHETVKKQLVKKLSNNSREIIVEELKCYDYSDLENAIRDGLEFKNLCMMGTGERRRYFAGKFFMAELRGCPSSDTCETILALKGFGKKPS